MEVTGHFFDDCFFASRLKDYVARDAEWKDGCANEDISLESIEDTREKVNSPFAAFDSPGSVQNLVLTHSAGQ